MRSNMMALSSSDLEQMKQSVDQLSQVVELSQVEFKIRPLHVDQSGLPKLPRHGAWLKWVRGGLGYELKAISCTGLCESPHDLRSSKECDQSSCVYARSFLALNAPSSSPAYYRLSLPSPSLSSSLDPDESRFCLSLFGKHAQDIFYWHNALQMSLLEGLGPQEIPYRLTQAYDLLSSRKLWTLDRQLSSPYQSHKESLAEIIFKRRQRVMTPREVSVQCTTALETRAELSQQTALVGEGLGPELSSILLLVIRRLERLESSLRHEHEGPTTAWTQISQRQLRTLCVEATLISTQLKRLKPMKPHRPSCLIGSLTYQLPREPIARDLVIDLLIIGSLIGIGRGCIEGRGSLSLRFR